MRILHVINSLSAGGAEKLVSELSSAQTAHNQVGLFTLFSQDDIFQDILDKDVHFYPGKGKRIFSIRKLIMLHKLIPQYDIIHVHLFPALYIVAFLSLFHRNKVYLLTEHNTTNRRRRPLFFWIEKLVYSRFHRIICISKGVEFALKKWISKIDNTVIIKNFVNVRKIRETSSYLKGDFNLDHNILLVMVGSFTSQKDQSTIIKSLQTLDNEIGLVLVGDGPRLIELEQLVEKLNLTSRVHFFGIRKDVVPIIKMCDYGILSSHWEGFGIVALEYMASGLITLGSNVEGLNEVITIQDNLFETENWESLANRIKTIEGDIKLKERILTNQSNIIASFDIAASVQEHQEVYQSLL